MKIGIVVTCSASWWAKKCTTCPPFTLNTTIVYLQMTGGQISLLGESEDLTMQAGPNIEAKVETTDAAAIPEILANSEELEQHEKWLDLLRKEAEQEVIWDKLPDV